MLNFEKSLRFGRAHYPSRTADFAAEAGCVNGIFWQFLLAPSGGGE
jgi:hypothetical protein